jgi:hypothetical protein
MKERAAARKDDSLNSREAKALTADPHQAASLSDENGDPDPY